MLRSETFEPRGERVVAEVGTAANDHVSAHRPCASRSLSRVVYWNPAFSSLVNRIVYRIATTTETCI